MEKTSYEVEVAQNGSREELIGLMKRTFLFEPAQVALVMRQDEELLEEYASRYSFGERAQVLMVQLRLKKALLKQLERHSLCVAAQKELVKMAFKE